MKADFKLQLIILLAFAFLVFVPAEVAGASKGRERDHFVEVGQCFNNLDCPNIYYCDVDVLGDHGSCRITVWIVIAIAVIVAFFLCSLVSCCCSPCCPLCCLGAAICSCLS